MCDMLKLAPEMQFGCEFHQAHKVFTRNPHPNQLTIMDSQPYTVFRSIIYPMPLTSLYQQAIASP